MLNINFVDGKVVTLRGAPIYKCTIAYVRTIFLMRCAYFLYVSSKILIKIISMCFPSFARGSLYVAIVNFFACMLARFANAIATINKVDGLNLVGRDVDAQSAISHA